MQFDTSIRITDIIMVVAVFVGPIVAVQLTELLRKRQDTHKRRVHVFRTLMATRRSNLAATHIEALNLLELEFHSAAPQDKKVVDGWKMYLAHLCDPNYQPKDGWEQRRQDLLVDLLYEMNLAIGYSFDKSSIKTGAYAPQAYINFENENTETRQLWLEILRGTRELPMRASVTPPPEKH
jgi:hypothetical protein